MPTLQDVAKHAGVSTATVSKVLSNTPYVSTATRNKVLKSVRETGYRPNLAARALASGKTYVIGVVFPYIYDTIFKDPLMMNILEGIETVCTNRGYNLLLSTPRLQKGKVGDHYMQLVQSGYIEGLIALDDIGKMSFAAVAENWNIPAVVLGYHDAQYQVCSDNYSGGKQMMEHILELGHRKMGIISVSLDMNMAIHARLEGIHNTYSEAGYDFGKIPIIEGDFSSESGAKATQRLLEKNPDITAILCINDRMAIGTIRQLQQMGKRIPEDISVIGYDNIPMASVLNPSLTTIDQQASKLGHTAAVMLFDLLNGNQPESVVIPAKLIIRESTASH